MNTLLFLGANVSVISSSGLGKCELLVQHAQNAVAWAMQILMSRCQEKKNEVAMPFLNFCLKTLSLLECTV